MISFSEYMNSNPGISGKKIETENPKDNVNESRVKNALEKVNEIANEIMEVLEPIQKSKVETVQESERVEHVEPVNEGYLLYRDKPENFTCDIAIEGAKLNQSEARIIIESEDWNLVFPGKIIGGKCTVPMKKLSLFEEGCKGKIKLEIIAEDTLFVPWEENFTVKTSKKVAVKIHEQESQNISSAHIRINNVR